MYILDTDLLSLLDRDTVEARNLTERLLLIPQHQVAVTIITYEEQMRGWLAWIAPAKTQERQMEGYRRLRQHIERFRVIPVPDYDERASVQFDRLRRARVRIGPMDLKIASIALSQDALLLSRNLVDYRKVPELRVEDWTIVEP